MSDSLFSVSRGLQVEEQPGLGLNFITPEAGVAFMLGSDS